MRVDKKGFIRACISRMDPFSWVRYSAAGGRFDSNHMFGPGSMDDKPFVMETRVREGWHQRDDYHFTVELWPHRDDG